MSPGHVEPQGLRLVEALVCVMAGMVLAVAILAFGEPEPHVVDDLFTPHAASSR